MNKYVIINILVFLLVSPETQSQKLLNTLGNSLVIDCGIGEDTYTTQEVLKFRQAIGAKRNFTYNYISKVNQRYELFDLEENGRLVEDKVIRANTPTENRRLVYEIDSKFKVRVIGYKVHDYYLDESIDSIYFQDKPMIEIMGKQLSIDSLYYGKDYNPRRKPLNSGFHQFGVVEIYKFTYGHNIYFIFNTEFIPTVSSGRRVKPILCIIDSSRHLTIVPPVKEVQSTGSPFCFNDFDEDGMIDYAQYSYWDTCTTLKVYHIKDGKYILNSSKYLQLFREYPKMPVILLDKSRWFFDLSKN